MSESAGDTQVLTLSKRVEEGGTLVSGTYILGSALSPPNQESRLAFGMILVYGLSLGRGIRNGWVY